MRSDRRKGFALMLAACASALIALCVEAGAQTPTPDDIVRKLTPEPQTRSIRGVTVTPGQEPEKPTIDLYINFEFDSAKLDTDGILVLKRLGTALKDPKLVNYRFEIAGHTDAVGTAEYNQKLSEQRAKAVVDHLVFYYEVPAARLTSIGYGKSRLLDPSRPNDGVNRRVQITNAGVQQ